jgi:hypothetical protein
MRARASWLGAGGAAALAGSLPYWLPGAVVALRVRIFAAVNGAEGIPVPGPEVPVEEFRRLYAHPAADGRSRGAALSDLFWYWLSPGAEIHQEHLEPGPLYDEVARTTRRILAGLSREGWAELVSRCTRHVLDEIDGPGGSGRNRTGQSRATRTAQVRQVRLRDLMMPAWAEVYYELVFREPCPPEARQLIVGHAEDVVNALKCTGLRHMDRRHALTRYLLRRLERDPLPVALPTGLTARQQAYYLQGTFFNTAVVQMSEATAHLLMAIATRPEVQQRLSADQDGGRHPGGDYLDRVIDETLRVYPLFGVAHRITSADIPRAGRPPVPAGSVLLFNYSGYQLSGPDADRFDPDRWLDPATRQGNYIPFGVTANRPCPARGFATATMRIAAEQTLLRYRLHSSAEHTRSLPNRGPCLLVPRSADRPRGLPVLRALMRLRDRWEAVPRSLSQLALGTYMVWDARRQGLCRRHFADQRTPDHAVRGAAG